MRLGLADGARGFALGSSERVWPTFSQVNNTGAVGNRIRLAPREPVEGLKYNYHCCQHEGCDSYWATRQGLADHERTDHADR